MILGFQLIFVSRLIGRDFFRLLYLRNKIMVPENLRIEKETKQAE